MDTIQAERRGSKRVRTRLRPGKILDADGLFLADCAILDRSPTGLRVRLFASLALSGPIRVLDERGRDVAPGRSVWQRAGEAGIAIAEEANCLEPRAFAVAAGPYYAVR